MSAVLDQCPGCDKALPPDQPSVILEGLHYCARCAVAKFWGGPMGDVARAHDAAMAKDRP